MFAKRLSRAIAGLCLAAGCVTAAGAEPIPRAGQSETDWRYTLAIYAFLPAST